MSNNYETEVRERWGDTDAYREYAETMKNIPQPKENSVYGGIYAIFDAFAFCKNNGDTIDSDVVRSLVKGLQRYITIHYYNCTDGILAELGKMYVADERFCENIDRFGEGTAEFVSKAIAVFLNEEGHYCEFMNRNID